MEFFAVDVVVIIKSRIVFVCSISLHWACLFYYDVIMAFNMLILLLIWEFRKLLRHPLSSKIGCLELKGFPSLEVDRATLSVKRNFSFFIA